MYGIKGIRLGDNIVAMLSRRASANRLPLGFLWWAKHLGVVGPTSSKKILNTAKPTIAINNKATTFQVFLFKALVFMFTTLLKLIQTTG